MSTIAYFSYHGSNKGDRFNWEWESQTVRLPYVESSSGLKMYYFFYPEQSKICNVAKCSNRLYAKPKT